MPSCAMKWCKNYTKVHNKSQGITFHTLPTNILIRDEWVAAVRLSRNDPQWQPSPSTVVCSDHFEKNDMYDTQHGLRRIHKTGYPKKECPIITEPDAGPSSRSETTSLDVVRPHTDVVTMPQVVSSRNSNSRFLVVGHDQNTQASTSATTSRQSDTWNKRKGSLPEAKTIIKSVFNYLQTEYENLKIYTRGSCDLSLLEDILGRTAVATGVSEENVTAVLEEGDSYDSSDESSIKRARVSHDYYDDNISPVEEDSSGESADEAQPRNRESSIDIEENPIETLKVEIDENVEYHSKSNPGILFQIPFSNEQMSVLQQSLSLTEPTHVEVKQEPTDVEEQQQMSVHHQSLSLTEPTHIKVKQEPKDVEEEQQMSIHHQSLSLTEPTHIAVKQEPKDVEEQQYSPFQIIGDIAIEHDNNQLDVGDEYLTIDRVQKPRQKIGVRSNKVPKTPAERAREFRARQALLKQRSKQQQEPDGIADIATEDIPSADQSKKQAKSAAQRMREYRKRKKLRLKRSSSAVEDTGGEQDPLGESTSAVRHLLQSNFEATSIKVEYQESTSAVHHLLQSNFEATSIKVEYQDVSAQVPAIADGVSESTKASTTEVQIITSRKKTRKSNAQRCREYRERKKLQMTRPQKITAKRCSETGQLIVRRPKTDAERRRKHYQAQKLKKLESKRIAKIDEQINKEYYDREKNIEALNTFNHHSNVESTKASTTEVQTITSRKNTNKTNAQRCRDYRERNKLQITRPQNITAKRSDGCSETDQVLVRRPKTNAERRKKHYEAQKLKKLESKKILKTDEQINKEYYDRETNIKALNTLNHHSDVMQYPSSSTTQDGRQPD